MLNMLEMRINSAATLLLLRVRNILTGKRQFSRFKFAKIEKPDTYQTSIPFLQLSEFGVVNVRKTLDTYPSAL